VKLRRAKCIQKLTTWYSKRWFSPWDKVFLSSRVLWNMHGRTTVLAESWILLHF
jgi:hypothetical protein